LLGRLKAALRAEDESAVAALENRIDAVIGGGS
jgi:hypothetical protein